MPKVTQEHIEKRRAEILDAAERVFKRKGFEPTTMQDVVEESGMSRGGVYQYFSSTEDMVQAIHERIIKTLPDYIEEWLADNETVWGAIEAYLSDYETPEGQEMETGFGIIMFEYSVTAWRNEKHRQFMLKNALEAQKHLVSMLQTGVDRGEFHPLQPLDVIVSFIVNVTDGLILHSAIANQDNFYLNEQVKALKIYLRTVLQVQEQSET
ncbi:MAG TPA: TetR family transcriptional regulator [Bacillales bacterium]|nr:TetR family transcriptional regulator [Bacillales bacterium]